MEEDKKDVIVDTPNDTAEDTVEVLEPETTEEIIETDPEVDVVQLQATNKKLYERAKKAEADLKELRGKKPVTTANAPSSQSVEETVLLANGMNEQLLEKLKKVAQLEDTTLIKAQASPIFVAVKDKFEADLKQKKASLGGSRGSGNIAPKKDFNTPGLTAAEHRKMVESLN